MRLDRIELSHMAPEAIALSIGPQAQILQVFLPIAWEPCVKDFGAGPQAQILQVFLPIAWGPCVKDFGAGPQAQILQVFIPLACSPCIRDFDAWATGANIHFQ